MMSWFKFRVRTGPRERGLHPLRVDDALTEEDLADHSHGGNFTRSGGAGKIIVTQSIRQEPSSMIGGMPTVLSGPRLGIIAVTWLG